MSVNTIESTVESTLNERGYGAYYISYALPVVAALKAREESIKDGLRTFANDKGLNDELVEALFVEVGLSQPTPVVIEEEAPVGNLDAVKNAAQALVDALANL